MAIGQEIQGDVKKYVDEAVPLLRERALRLPARQRLHQGHAAIQPWGRQAQRLTPITFGRPQPILVKQPECQFGQRIHRGSPMGSTLG